MKKGIYNKTTKQNINMKIKFADTYFKRLKGLMFKKNIDYGLVFIIKAKSRFNSGIHTSFMKFNIDVYFLDENLKIFDIENTKKLTGIGDIEIFENPNELLDFLKDY